MDLEELLNYKAILTISLILTFFVLPYVVGPLATIAGSEPSNVHISLDWSPKHAGTDMAYDGEIITVTETLTFTPGTRTTPIYATDVLYTEATDAFVGVATVYMEGAFYDRLTSSDLQSGIFSVSRPWHASTQQWSYQPPRNGLRVVASIWGVSATLNVYVTNAPSAVVYGLLYIHVVDKGGYLVLGADVRVKGTSYDKTYNSGDSGGFWSDQIPLGVYDITATKDGYTGSATDFLQNGVESTPGWDYVKVTIPGYQVSGPSPKPTDPIISSAPSVAPQPGSLQGTIMSVDGNWLSGASLVAKPAGGGATGSASVKTDAYGWYTMNLAPGVYDITCSGSGYITQTQEFAVYNQAMSGMTIANFNMFTSSLRSDLRFGFIAGFVKTNDGIPLPGASVTGAGITDEFGWFSCYFEGGSNVASMFPSATITSFVFPLAAVYGGPWTITALKANYLSTSTTVTVSAGQLSKANLVLNVDSSTAPSPPPPPPPPQYQLTMQANPSNGGTVSPSSGSYAEQVQISASPASGYSFQGWSGSGSGSYTGPAQSAIVTMNGPIVEIANFQVILPNTLSVQISVNPSIISTGQTSTTTIIVSSSGGVISGASISLSKSGGSLAPISGTTDSDGKLISTFSSSTTGTFTITASASKSGYSVGSGSTQVVVSTNPPPPPAYWDMVVGFISYDVNWWYKALWLSTPMFVIAGYTVMLWAILLCILVAAFVIWLIWGRKEEE